MCIPIVPSAAGSLPASSPCRKAIERRFEKTDYCARECQGPSSPLVPASVVVGPFSRAVPGNGAAGAARCSSARRTSGRRADESPPSKRRPTAFPQGYFEGSDPSRGGGGRLKARTPPRPNQAPVALGSLPSTARAASTPRPTARRSRKTLPRQRISRPAGVHHRRAKVCIDPPLSHAHSSTAPSRSAGYRPTRLRRTALLARRCRRAPPATRSAATSASKMEWGMTMAAKSESKRLVGQSVGRSTAGTTASMAIKFRRAGRAAAARERRNAIVTGAPDGGQRPERQLDGNQVGDDLDGPLAGARPGGPLGTLRLARASSAHDAPLPVGGSEGGTAPRQPRSGTREAWPQGVCWLPGISGVRQALR